MTANEQHEPKAAEAAQPGQSAEVRASLVAQLFKQHNRNLVHFIRARMGGPASDASEVAQESYVRLLQLENTGAVSFLRAYLYRIAANLVIDRNLARRRRPELSAESVKEEFEHVPDPFEIERSVLAADQYQQLLACLRELSPKCREAFELHRLQEWSVEEVAQKMGLSERMVRKYVARALIYCRFRMDGDSREATLEIMGHD
jgi:RNA polymerase sigma factor (sigma-70 family)